MSITENGLELRHLELVASLASAIGRLPAVPSQDWCARASAIVQSIRPSAIVSTTIAGVGPQGEVSFLEATGAVGADAQGRALDGQPINPDNITSFGWHFQQGLDAPRVANLRALPCASEWPATPAARRWSRFGVTELSVAIARIPCNVAHRALVIEIGAAAGDRAWDKSELTILRALLPLLATRAGLAFGPDVTSPLTRLTSREQEVLEHLTLGKSVKEIAEDLARSPHTVHDHVKSLHRKLNATSRGELIARTLGHLSESNLSAPDAVATRAQIRTDAVATNSQRSHAGLLSA